MMACTHIVMVMIKNKIHNNRYC